MAAKARSKVLQDDRLIYQLTESIDSVKHYFPLGRDLLGSQAAVSNIIGRTEPDFQEIVFKCLYTWRNANGRGAGVKLVEIFRGVELDKVVASLEQELQRRPNCLSEDVYLQSLASKLDCAVVYRKLGLPLLENNSVKFSNLIAPVNIPFAQYQDSLFHVLIKWRNQAGSSIASLEDLEQAFLRHGLIDTAQLLHRLEYSSNAISEFRPFQDKMDTPITDEELLDIAGNVPSTDYHKLGFKLGQGLERLEEILESKNNDCRRSTVAILMSWRGAEPGVSSRMKRSRLRQIFSSLGIKPSDALLPTSADFRTNSSLQRNEDARRTVESQQRGAPPYQASDSATSGSSQLGQPKFYDIYLKFSQETVHVHKVKDIIRRNGWTMMTANNCRLGVPKMTSIEDALKTCSHMVLILTKEDCEKNDPYQTMTMGMAFQSTVGRSLNGRVISIRCCEESHLPLSLQSLENACINDPYLEDKLKRTIDE